MESPPRLHITPQMLQLRDFRPFKTSDEYLWAMKEDLSDWLITLYPDLTITPHTFMECLETGVILCKHANNVKRACLEWIEQGKKLPKCWGKEWKLPNGDVYFNPNARPETFYARDNVHNFIFWCRQLGIFDCLMFESDDLILRKNEKNVILCLLEVARRGSHFGMAMPLLVQFEKEIDRDIAKDTGVDLSSSGEEEESLLEYGPIAQIITNDLRSLDERVRELVERCSCPTQFPMIRVAEGKYRIGNTKVMIYVRILRNHVMVRVGGGWDTLAHYLDKHDPCRCSSSHRAAISSKFILKNDGATPRMKVEYESPYGQVRRDLSYVEASTNSTPPFGSKKPTDLSDSGSEISDEGYKTSDNSKFMDRNGVSQQNVTGGHGSRRGSLVRNRSASIDEDRPESRSTDEDVGLAPQNKGNGVLKSHSTSRVPSTFTRGTPSGGSNLATPFRKRYVSGENSKHETGSVSSSSKHIPHSHPPNVLLTRNKAHTRSLSAGGSAEFFGRQNTYGPSSGQKLARPGVVPKSCNTTPMLGRAAFGKNTWNGHGTAPRVKNRPNLFQPEIYRNKRQNSDLGGVGQTHPEPCDAANNPLPDLASCIKQALELNSDADKISHIELVIKQYELHRSDSNPTDETVSLPFISPNSFSVSSKPAHIPKRKETGMTKIPRPNFY